MSVKIVKMEAGDFAWNVAGITLELNKWESYNFMDKQWVPAENHIMFCMNPYPYPEGNFYDALHNRIKDLSSEATVYVYESNETFGALRPKPI